MLGGGGGGGAPPRCEVSAQPFSASFAAPSLNINHVQQWLYICRTAVVSWHHNFQHSVSEFARQNLGNEDELLGRAPVWLLGRRFALGGCGRRRDPGAAAEDADGDDPNASVIAADNGFREEVELEPAPQVATLEEDRFASETEDSFWLLWRSILRMTYRRNLKSPMYRKVRSEPEEFVELRSDAGWGCTVRVGQMLLMQSFRRHFRLEPTSSVWERTAIRMSMPEEGALSATAAADALVDIAEGSDAAEEGHRLCEEALRLQRQLLEKFLDLPHRPFSIYRFFEPRGRPAEWEPWEGLFDDCRPSVGPVERSPRRGSGGAPCTASQEESWRSLSPQQSPRQYVGGGGAGGYQKIPGDWFGPATISFRIQDLVASSDLARELQVYVDSDGVIYRAEVQQLLHQLTEAMEESPRTASRDGSVLGEGQWSDVRGEEHMVGSFLDLKAASSLASSPLQGFQGSVMQAWEHVPDSFLDDVENWELPPPASPVGAPAPALSPPRQRAAPSSVEVPAASECLEGGEKQEGRVRDTLSVFGGGEGGSSVGGSARPGVLLLLPLQLGQERRVDRASAASIPRYLQLPWSVGMMGGRPRKAHYFVGCQAQARTGPQPVRGGGGSGGGEQSSLALEEEEDSDMELLYLDPHVVQEAAASIDQDVRSFENTRWPERLPMDQMDPSIALAFYVRDGEDFGAFAGAIDRIAEERSDDALLQTAAARPAPPAVTVCRMDSVEDSAEEIVSSPLAPGWVEFSCCDDRRPSGGVLPAAAPPPRERHSPSTGHSSGSLPLDASLATDASWTTNSSRSLGGDRSLTSSLTEPPAGVGACRSWSQSRVVPPLLM